MDASCFVERPVRRFLQVLLAILCSTNAAFAAAPLPSLLAPPSGTLFIVGGGVIGDDVMGAFVKLGGGDEGRLVIITTANYRAETAPEEIVTMWRDRTKAELTLLHARSADEANSEAFVAPIRKATAVWLMSGKQNRLTERYLGTNLLRELHAFHHRGGVIGGSSAGAAVMSDVMLCGGTMEEPGIFEGFGFLKGAIVDQHYLARKREPRLRVALDRHPGRVGFGIDEGTALVVRGRELSVIGPSTVSVVLPEGDGRPVRTTMLKHGDREDLTALHRAALARADQPFPPSTLERPKVGHGSLLIVGGGKLPIDIQKRFIALAGGPKSKIVVLQTDEDRDARDYQWLKKAGATNFEVVNPPTRAEADSPGLVAKIRNAAGVWFGGGRQWRFVDSFEGTACYRAFHDVLNQGGVIGGSSAGATIQGEYLVRGSPLDNTTMMAEGYERGFGFLPGTAIDQHFTQRNRKTDMELLKQTYPQLLGLGIDEATAVVVRGSRLEVCGEGTVSVYPPMEAAAPVRTVSAESTDKAELPIPSVLKTGEAYDLLEFRTLQSAE